MNAAEITCAFTVVIERQIGKRWKGRKCSKGWGLRNAGCLFLIENDLLWKTLYKTIHHAFLSWFSLVWRVDICPSAGWLKLSRVFVGWLCVCCVRVCVCACVRVCARAWRAGVACVACVCVRACARVACVWRVLWSVSGWVRGHRFLNRWSEMCLGELVSAWDWKSVCVSFSAENLTEGDWQLCADAFWFKNAFFFFTSKGQQNTKKCRFEVTDSSHLESSQN